MAAGDAAWLHMDRRVNPLVVTAVLWFDGPLDWDEVRDTFRTRVLDRFPRFTQRVVDEGTAAWWEDDSDFDVERHVEHGKLGGAGDLADLTGYVSELTAVALPRDRPLWQLHLVDGYGAGSAIVARIHHCLADGMALFRVLMSLTDTSDGGDGADTIGQAAPARRGGFSVLERAGQVARVGRAAAGLVVLPPDRRTVLRGPLDAAKSVAWSAPIPLPALQQAARAAGATINDLVLAALAGGLRRHLDGAGGRVRDVRAVLPVNLRPPAQRIPTELGNLFGLVFLRLPLTSALPAERIALVQQRTSALKRSLQAVAALQLIRVLGRLPYRVVQVVVDVFSAKGSAVVTNVAGPPDPVYLAGTRLAGAIAWPPQSGSVGLGVSVISYGGQVVVGVMADDLLLPDPQQLLADTCAGLRELGVAA